MGVLEEHGAYEVQSEAVEECSRSVHVIVISRYSTKKQRKRGERRHPYISGLPEPLQKHFNPRKMDRDRFEEPYDERAEGWFVQPEGESVKRDLDAVSLPVGYGKCYVLPLTTSPSRKDYEGLTTLSKKFYRRVCSFLLDLNERTIYLSFLGIGIGGLVCKGALGMLRRETSAMRLSLIDLRLQSFVTLNTPHMGIRRPPELGNLWKWIRHWWVMSKYGMVGRELLLEDPDFVLMEMAMHDLEVGEAMECFKTVAFATTKHDRFCPVASGALMADPKMTPLGQYVHLCGRTEHSTEGIAPRLPDLRDEVPKAGALPWMVQEEVQGVVCESLFGLPVICCCAYLFVAFQSSYFREVLGSDTFMYVQLVMSLVLLAVLSAIGYAYASGMEAPEDKYAHLGDPHGKSTYFKVATRMHRTAPNDRHAELCVNIVKEVLNARYFSEAIRVLLGPSLSEERAVLRAARLLDLKTE